MTNSKTTAETVADIAGGDGMNFPPMFIAACESASAIEHKNRGISGEPIRYQFADGSAIVEAGDAWDIGVHRDRLDDAALRYRPEPTSYDEYDGDIPASDLRALVPFAWPAAEHGLTEDDCFPPAAA